MTWVRSSGVLVGALDLSRVLDAMEAMVHLKPIKPARAGNKIEQGLSLLLIVEALHRPVFCVVKGYVNTLALPMVHPSDQHFLDPDHDVGLA